MSVYLGFSRGSYYVTGEFTGNGGVIGIARGYTTLGGRPDCSALVDLVLPMTQRTSDRCIATSVTMILNPTTP